jgi:hypothetical protein
MEGMLWLSTQRAAYITLIRNHSLDNLNFPITVMEIDSGLDGLMDAGLGVRSNVF